MRIASIAGCTICKCKTIRFSTTAIFSKCLTCKKALRMSHRLNKSRTVKGSRVMRIKARGRRTT
jgi:hypothetical protein